MNKKIIYVFGALYIFLISMKIFILFIIFNWNNTLNYTISSSMLTDINIQIIIAFLGISVMIISTYLLFKLNLKLSSIFGFIGTTTQLIIYFIPPIIISSYRNGMELDEFILTNNVYRSISVFYLLFICLAYLINILPMIYNRFKRDLQEFALIRKTILELGTKYPRLQAKEIAEICKIDLNTIIRIIREMIKNNEIYAQYFKIYPEIKGRLF